MFKKNIKHFHSLGIMTGTSLDGIDISLISSDGQKFIKSIHNKTYNYSSELKNQFKTLIKIINEEKITNIREFERYKALEKVFNIYCIKKIQSFLKDFKVNIKDINIVGFHGQTIYHNANKKISIQMGSGKYLANFFGVPFIVNFRNRDIFDGGQGAPLVPIFHKTIFDNIKKPVYVINIGGISNVTWIGYDNFFSADVGPGNTLIDQYCVTYLKKKYDLNGSYSKMGNINKTLLKNWLAKDIFKFSLPNSFDNYEFILEKFIERKEKANYDVLATLTKLTATLIYKSHKLFPEKPKTWVICGGGIHNKSIIDELKTISGKKIFVSSELGWSPDFIESQAFGYLAIRRILNLASSFPNTTGVQKPTICGDVFYPDQSFT